MDGSVRDPHRHAIIQSWQIGWTIGRVAKNQIERTLEKTCRVDRESRQNSVSHDRSRRSRGRPGIKLSEEDTQILHARIVLLKNRSEDDISFGDGWPLDISSKL